MLFSKGRITIKIITYVLIIKVKQKFRTRIGAKGERVFDAGYYLYVGSGKEHLMQRIRRHLKMEKKKFWHIDYLLAHTGAVIQDVNLSVRPETEVVSRLEQNGMKAYDSFFGASDSKKASHLFYCRSYRALRRTKQMMDGWL